MGEPKASLGSQRLDALTSFRFFAALMVVILHYGTALRSVSPKVIDTIWGHGGEGVTFFFTLSGFILAYTYSAKAQPTGSLNAREFLVNRFARVYPVLFLCLVLRLPWLLHSIQWESKTPLVWGAYFLSHFLVLQAWYPPFLSDPSWLNQAWTLTVEAFFYCSFLFIFPLVTRLRTRTVVISALVLVIACAFGRFFLSGVFAENPFWSWQLPPLRMGEFYLGIATCILFFRSEALRERGPLIGYVGLALWVGILAIPYTIFDWWQIVLNPISAAILIFGFATVRSRILTSKLLVLLGEASYSLYLVHGICHDVLSKVLAKLTKATIHDSLGLFMLYAVFSCVVSIFMFMYIEKPARSYLRRVLQPK